MIRGGKILVVEDDEDIMELVAYNLAREGFAVIRAESGEEGLGKVDTEMPDLILLDIMLPEIDGLEVCRKLKSDANTAGIPVVMVSAKGDEPDIVAGLELGADDYVTKPFRPKELVARVRAVLRRASGMAEEPADSIKAGEVEIHPGKREARVGGKQLSLTWTEFHILHLLAGRPGWVFTRHQIVNAVRGDSHTVTDRSVDVQIVGLRKKLGRSSGCIETVRGVGYRFNEAAGPEA